MRMMTAADVAAENKEGQCLLIISGKVYDVTAFAADHPGGDRVLTMNGGKDVTDQFEMLHRPEILETIAKQYLVGVIVDEKTAAGGGGAATTNAGGGGASTASTAGVELVSPVDTSTLRPGATQSWNSGGTAELLPRERARATFDPEVLTNILDGGKEATKRRRFILGPQEGIERRDTKNGTDTYGLLKKYDMSRRELIRKHFRDFIGIHKPFVEQGYIPKGEEARILSLSFHTTIHPMFFYRRGAYFFHPAALHTHRTTKNHRASSLCDALTLTPCGHYCSDNLFFRRSRG